MPRKAGALILKTIKWILIAALGIEALCFAAISLSNYIIYGHMWEGSRSAYDAHAIFLQRPTPRATSFNSSSPAAEQNRVIWMFGGSTTRSSGEEARLTIASRLAQRLNSRGRPLHFTVINYGQNSFNSLLEVQLLQKLLIREQRPPSMIIFYDGANEATYLSQYRTVDGHFGYRRMRSLVGGYRNSALGIFKAFNAFWYASATRELYDKLHQVALPLESDPKLVAEYVRLLQRRYGYVTRIARAHGAGFLACWQPTAWTEAPGSAPEVRAREELLADQQAMAEFGRNMRVVYSSVLKRMKGKPYFLDLHRVLEQRGDKAYKPDGVHLLPAGRAKVAEAMAEPVRNLLARPSHADTAR